ncbi:MAG: hypothetical protein A3F11_11790 [Gammaproteobacteria bacterium RIFCSPHIGHO2_12_FULL_37_14]|nr:MAG: hypothetical protein A3F11_11790 [Gammaproteobacteria bacterium RIFCSPHIGHO2_12_FULL_37_14]
MSLFFSFNVYSFSDILKYFIATKHAQCPFADPVVSANFCASFKTAAECRCTSSGLPSGMCKDMTAIYNRMVSVFGSQQKACDYQKDVSTQECMDDWNCYRLGGKDSHGNLCSSTGKAC